MNIDSIKEEFRKHVFKYDMDDKDIKRKYYHSNRVMDLCRLIGFDNNFNEKDMEIATLIGLLHDYARFEQWTKYGTWSDIKSIDHGELAVKMLFEDKEIENYYTDSEYYNVIEDAIKYHNKYSYPSYLAEYNKLFCKVIRDADKLDIFYMFTIGEFFLEEDDCVISEKVRKDFFSNKIISKLDIKNKSDNILLVLAMVFDLNFDYSFRYLYEFKIIDKILKNINDKGRFKIYFDYVNKYIEERING